MLGDKIQLVKCYKCDYYHIEGDERNIKEIKDGEFTKWICNICRTFSERTKEDLKIGTSFDKSQIIIIKDLAYRVRHLELENNGQRVKIERLENSLEELKKIVNTNKKI